MGRCSITEASLRAMPPFLTTLDIAECDGIHDFAPLAGLTSLTSLNLGGCHISAEQLLQVCKCCPLTSLDVSCSLVDDSTLTLIAVMLPRLLDLDLRNCIYVGDAGIKAISDSCSRLLHLELRGCSAVSSNVVDFVMGALPCCKVEFSIPK